MAKDLILYVHVPFCSSKCHFCSWVSPIAVADLVKSKDKFHDYSEAVLTEIQRSGELMRGKNVRPRLIYFGGGTPSVLSAQDLALILGELNKQFPSDTNHMDITIEISPDTATSERLFILKEAGFNRISFGVQSFNEQRARSLGRAHSPLTAIQAFELARRAGFENINIDLMIGLPEESEDEYLQSIDTALMLDPDHISIYVYKQFPGTVLSNQINAGRLNLCPKTVAVERYEIVTSMLSAAGFSEYMFQLFSKDEKRCLVDFHYFNLDTDFIGFGQGAHSLIDKRQYFHSQTLSEYLAKPRHSHSTVIADAEKTLITKLYEMMHFEEGLDFGRFSDRLGISVADATERHPNFRKALASAFETGPIEQTSLGLRFADRESRLRWLARPPYWQSDYMPENRLQPLIKLSAL